MSPALPRFLPRSPAEPGSLAEALVRGDGDARALFPGERAVPGPVPADPADLPPLPPGGDLPPDAVRASGPDARERAEAALSGEGAFVTTGQQPLLLGGPLYVLYKALTAVAVAEALERAGTPAVALFWVAGDDHDWDEVGRTRILDTGNRLRELRLEPDPDRSGRAVGPSPLPDRITDRIDDIAQHLPNSEFVDGYLELIREAWAPGRSFSEAFGRTLEGLLEGRPLAWVDASDPALRRAEAPLFRRVLEEPDAVEERLEQGSERVRSAGWAPQAEREAGALPLFVDTPGGRRRVHRAGEDFRLGREGERVARDRLLGELEEAPERFSPDVSLRPVASCGLLPTAVTVLGPSEMAYWAQLPGLFAWAEVPFPRLRARDGWTVLEDKIAKVLEKLDAGPDDFRDGGETLAERVREEGRPGAVDEALSEARTGVARALDEVEEAVGRELPGIRSAVGKARHRAFEVLDDLASAVDDRVDERHAVVLEQIRKAAAHLWPDGRPQERVLSPLYHLARYGSGFIRALEEATRDRLREDRDE